MSPKTKSACIFRFVWYNDRMTDIKEFDPDLHAYYLNGKQVRSVTTILRQAELIGGFGPAYYAKQRGNRVHELCDRDDREPLDMRKVTADERNWLRAWRDFRAISEFTPTENELKVWCPKYGYAGTLDRVGKRAASKWPVVLDIKTAYAGGPADYVKYQTVAYAFAYQPGQLFERMGVTLRPDRTFAIKVWGVDTFQQDLARWLQIVEETKNIPLDA